MDFRVFYVGQDAEVAHQAKPLQELMPVEVAPVQTVRQNAQPGDVVIFYSEHFDRFRTLCMQLKQRGVGTLYAIDGILEWRNAWENRPDEIACPWTMRPCLSDVVATIGPRQTAVLQSWGNPNCLPVGLPRLDPLARDYRQRRQDQSSEPADPCSDPANRRSSDVAAARRSVFRLLVLTAKCPGFTPQQIETTFRSLQSVVEFLSRHPVLDNRPIQVAWRLTGDLERRLGVTNSGRPGDAADLPAAIRAADAVLATPSTAILEAMLLDRPVALLDFHNAPTYADCVYRITHPDQLATVLGRMMRHAESAAHRGMQEFLLHENLSADGLASQRMTAVIHWLHRCRAQAWQQGVDPRFDPTEIDPWPTAPPSDASQWQPLGSPTGADPVAVTSDDPGATIPIAQWRAHAEQLERENRRLERLVAEAHQVFESMHAHPVLGSILKSHRWWSRWWSGSDGALDRPASWKEPRP